MSKTIFLRSCLLMVAFIPFGLFAQIDSTVKPYRSGYAFDKYSTLNIYGKSVFGRQLLDTTLVAEDIVRNSLQNRDKIMSDWLMLDSFWKEEKGREIIYELLKFTLLYTDWDRYQRGTVNKKDLKYLRVLAERMLLHHTENGPHITELIKEKRFSNSSGTAFLTSILNQLQWPFEIRRYENHLFIIILGENEKYILDCMHLKQIWKYGKDDKKYLKALESESFKDRPVSMNTILDKSTILSFQQLVAIQKVSESEQLKKTNPYSAIERLEVAYYFWPQNEILENLRETCRALFNSYDKENDWSKLYAAAKYIQLSQDDSEITKSQFNLLLGNTLEYYSKNEQMTLGHPPTMRIREKNSYFSNEIPVQDTFNRIGGFDFNQYVGFQLTDDKMRGFFHSLRFASSKESSGGSDYQFYIDALYIYSYLDHSTSLMQSICAVQLSNYDYFHSIPDDLLSHLKGGAIDSSIYHEMCALFYFTHLSSSAPKNVSEASKIDIPSIRYSLYIELLAEELKYVDNPDLITEIKEYVLTVLPIFSQKLVPVEQESLETIGAICGMEQFSDLPDESN